MRSRMLRFVLISTADTRCPDHWRAQLFQRSSRLSDRAYSQRWYVCSFQYECMWLANMHCTGQWAPIVGTGLALFGSLYVALAAPETPEGSETLGSPRPPSTCSPNGTGGPSRSPGDLARTQTHTTVATLEGTRRTVAGWLTTVAEYVGTPQEKSYDDAGFRRGRAMAYPSLPGEENRNPGLSQLTREWTNRDLSREPSIRRATSTHTVTRERSNTADTLQLPSPTHHRPSRDSLNLPEMVQITTSAREQSPPAIVVTPDPGASDHRGK